MVISDCPACLTDSLTIAPCGTGITPIWRHVACRILAENVLNSVLRQMNSVPGFGILVRVVP